MWCVPARDGRAAAGVNKTAVYVKAGAFPKVERASRSAVSAIHKTVLHSVYELLRL